MSCCAKGVSDHKKADVELRCFGDAFEQLVDLNFTEVPVSFNELPAQEFPELFSVDTHDGRVMLEIDFLRRFYGVEASNSDVFG